MAYANKKIAIKKQNAWIAKAYDRINLTVPKGKRQEVQEYAKAHNTSVNQLICNLIDAELHKRKE
jgi:hypothetical protein